jgi:hypothetical protein
LADLLDNLVKLSFAAKSFACPSTPLDVVIINMIVVFTHAVGPGAAFSSNLRHTFCTVSTRTT